jgi:hypothetical protein
MKTRHVAKAGAVLGTKLALLYSGAFILVAAIRYGYDLFSLHLSNGFWSLLAAGALSLAASALAIGLVMSVIAGGIGAATALCAAGAVHLWRAQMARTSVTAVALLVAAAVAAALHYAFWRTGLLAAASLFSSAYWFWLGLPTVIYLLAAGWAGHRGEQAPTVQARAQM